MNHKSDELNNYLKMIGKKIQTQRLFMNLSREELAEQAKISPRSVASIEDGKQEMSITTAKKVCEALHLSVSYLLADKEDANVQDIANLLKICNSEEELKCMESIIRQCLHILNHKT